MTEGIHPSLNRYRKQIQEFQANWDQIQKNIENNPFYTKPTLPVLPLEMKPHLHDTTPPHVYELLENAVIKLRFAPGVFPIGNECDGKESTENED